MKRPLWCSIAMCAIVGGSLLSDAYALKLAPSLDRPPAWLVEEDRWRATIFRELNPSVVNISIEQAKRRTKKPTQFHSQDAQKQNLGSGVIIDSQGFIVTNHHVIKGHVKIVVGLASGQEFTAEPVGHDLLSDLAVIKITRKASFKAAVFGDSDTVQVGDSVLAIGNPFGFNNTLTAGIVSARGRVISPTLAKKRFDDFIQIDASVNPGNSGGPLVDRYGKIIGINTAITSKGWGIAFAVPSNRVKRIVGDIRRVGYPLRGWLGVVVGPPKKGRTSKDGLQVVGVTPGGPAQKAGLRKGDFILTVGKVGMRNLRILSETIVGLEPKSTVKVKVRRGESIRTIEIKVGDLHKDARLSPTTPSS